jgi:hypothetical protein
MAKLSTVDVDTDGALIFANIRNDPMPFLGGLGEDNSWEKT